MSDTKNNEQATTPTPEETGGKLFTQEEVNRIVSDRLKREKEQATRQADIDERERALKEREQAFEAREARAAKEAAVRAYYQQKGVTGKALEIAMKGSAQEIDALELTDGQIKDYSSIDALIGGVFSGLVSETRIVGAQVAHPPTCYTDPGGDSMIANAFKPKI